MVANPFVPHPHHLIGRQTELQQVQQTLEADGDLVITGVAGSGRRTLVYAAAHAIGVRVLEVDCIRATNSIRFLQLLADSLVLEFTQPHELSLIQKWSLNAPVTLEKMASGQPRLMWHLTPGGEWTWFQAFLSLPQQLAETLNCRIVVVLQNFSHIRSWDRSGKWETYLKQQIQAQSRVSYAILTTVPQDWVQEDNVKVLALAPLPDDALGDWIETAMADEGLRFEASGAARRLFLDYVQGHFGDAIALARRIWLDSLALRSMQPDSLSELQFIQSHQVHRSAIALIEDLSLTFESLILLLPPSQVRVLESLALDPTDSPHSRDYIQKHQLSRGGGLQGALASLEQKGLVYGPQQGYRIALPLLALWLKQRLA